MDVHTNIPLKNYTTMRLGGAARFMASVTSADEIPSLYKKAREKNLRVEVLGGGSNTIVHDRGFDGLVMRMLIPGIEVIASDIHSATIKVGAGVIWDDFVKFSVDNKLSGIEAMSAIPGTVGAAPVQNVGAYGQEVSDTFVELTAYDTETDQFTTLNAQDCAFSYRNSIFRGTAKGRYIISSVTFKLSKNPPQPPFYDALQRYLDEHNIAIYTQENIRQAVTEIRTEKLPDPATKPNSGSFFKNAIVEAWQLDHVKSINPNAPNYEMGGGKFKIPTGWLIEQAGLKGKLLNGMRVHDKNALVLINESATSYSDLEEAREAIQSAVRNKFRIEIEQEPLEI